MVLEVQRALVQCGGGQTLSGAAPCTEWSQTQSHSTGRSTLGVLSAVRSEQGGACIDSLR